MMKSRAIVAVGICLLCGCRSFTPVTPPMPESVVPGSRYIPLGESDLTVQKTNVITLSWTSEYGMVHILTSTNLSQTWVLNQIVTNGSTVTITNDAPQLFVKASGQLFVTLEWNASPDSSVAGYFIYYGVESRSYTNKTDVGNTTMATLFGFVPGVTYYFTTTAYNILGLESDYSNEVSYTILIPPSMKLSIRML